jgi:hypothetical protein
MILQASAGYSDSSRTTFVAFALGLRTNLGLEQSWLFPAFSVKFHTRSSLKSWWVYLAPHEDNGSQLLSTVRSRNLKKQFYGPLEGTSTHRIVVGHLIRIVSVTQVPVILFL